MFKQYINEIAVIFGVTAILYLFVEYSAHAFNFPSLFVPQFLLCPLLCPEVWMGVHIDLLDVDVGGMGCVVRALAFAIIATFGIWPVAQYLRTRSKVYLGISIAVWLWYLTTLAWLVSFIWAFSHSGWTD